MFYRLFLFAFFLGGVARGEGLNEHRLCPGEPCETPYYVQKSGEPGPMVVIVGGMHGNEPAGAYAAEQIRHWPIRRGTLVTLPRANVLALDAKLRLTPGQDESLSNLNRNFPRAGRTEPPRGKLAEAIWSLVQKLQPQWVIDLHEGYDFHGLNPGSVGSSVIASADGPTREIAQLLLDQVNATVTNPERRFVLRGPPIDSSLARAAAEHLTCQSMILETTFKDQPLPLRARQHRRMVHTLLSHLGMLDERLTPDTLVTSLSPPDTKHIALYCDRGVTGKGAPRLEEQLSRQPNVRVVQLCGDDIRAGMLVQFDVAIFSGGSGSAQAASLQEEGRKEVRRFVERGGMYVGICAGSYLACNGFSWGLKILDARTASSQWRRGTGEIELELTELGREVFSHSHERLPMHYANGPILVPGEAPELPDFRTLAWFRGELAENGSPKGIMAGSPAVVLGKCGQGRVVCFSPHPEQTAGCEEFVWKTIAHAAPNP